MFAVIFVPDFQLQAALRAAEGRSARAVALVDAAESNRPVILQLTHTAQQAGVCAGMTVTQAMARCPQIVIHRRSSAQERAANAALLDCAWAFSPSVEATSDGVCTLDLQGHRNICYEDVAAKMLDCLARLQLAAQVGIGENPLLAWHAARAARPSLVIRDVKKFMGPLPIESIEPSAEVRVILRKWGVHTLGEFLALGKNALGERLGPEGLALFDRASANATRPLRLANPPKLFEEALEFEHEVETAEALLFVLRRFIEQLSARLEFVYLVAEELILRLMLADSGKYEHVLKIPAPTRRIDTLFGMLQTHLETLRTQHPIVGVFLAARPCRPASQQLELFESNLRDPNQFAETLARLAALLGHDRVGMPVVEANHRPDAFAMEPLGMAGGAESEAAPPPQPSRGLCLRRFRPPARAPFDCRKLPKAGPWDSSGHWWDEQRWSRVEWDLEGEAAALYRAFQKNGHWFMDAVYD